MHMKFWLGRQKIDYLEDISIDEKIILELFLGK
jgi:hypothetical protein